MEFDKEIVSFSVIEHKEMTVNISASENFGEDVKLLSVSGISSVGRSEIIGGELIIEGNVQFCAVLKTKDGEIKKITKSEHFSKNETIKNIKGNSACLTSSKTENVKGYFEAGNILFNCVTRLNSKIFSPCEKEIPLIYENDFLRKKESKYTVADDVFTLPLRFSLSEKSELSPRLPDVKEVLNISAIPNIKEANIIANQLVFGGEIFVQTTYSTNDEYEPIVQVNEKFDFSQIDDVNCSSERENVNVFLNAESVFSNVSQNAEGENRIIDYTFDLCGYAYSFNEKELSVLDDIYSTKEKLKTEKDFLNCKTEKMIYKTQGNKNFSVALIKNKPPMSRINSVNLSVGNINYFKDTIKVQADVNVNYQSSSGECEGFNTTAEFEIFSEKCDNCNDFFVNLTVTDVQGILISGNEMEIRVSYYVSVFSYFENKIDYVNLIDFSSENILPEYGIIIYTVQKNDSLWDICKHYCVDEEEVKQLNPQLENGIYPGQKIYIFRKLAV